MVGYVMKGHQLGIYVLWEVLHFFKIISEEYHLL